MRIVTKEIQNTKVMVGPIYGTEAFSQIWSPIFDEVWLIIVHVRDSVKMSSIILRNRESN